MTADLYAGVNGERLTAVRLTVSNQGPWVADVDFEAEPEVSGKVTLTVGVLELIGTLVAAASGTFGLQRRARIVGGAGAWADAVEPKQYHADNGVRAETVAQDAARAVGETLGDFLPTAERIGRDYVRQAGPASRALEDVLGGAPWWVGYDGITRVGPRPAVALDPKAYTVLAYDPRDRLLTLATDDVGALQIGAIVTDARLDAPQTVRSFELRLTSGELRVLAWCGGTETGHGQLASLLRSIVQHTASERLWGSYRYRVVRMAGERVELQSVRRIVGLPDLLPLSMWPGIPGAFAQLAPGAEVLISFVEGDRAQPVVVGFAGPDSPGFVPTMLTLGGKEGAPIARQGDVVEVQLPPANFTATVVGTTATGVMTFAPMNALGVITGGSTKVRVGA